MNLYILINIKMRRASAETSEMLDEEARRRRKYAHTDTHACIHTDTFFLFEKKENNKQRKKVV